MIRVADGNAFKVMSFYDLFFGRGKAVWTRDVDHHAPPWLLSGLSARTGILMPRLEALTLRSLETRAFESLNPKGATRWVMSIGVYHRERRLFGQQCCPRCLAEDVQPHLRLTWRLAMSTVCVSHRLHLLDRCGACRKPLVWHRNAVGLPHTRSGLEWVRCSRCSHDLMTDVTMASDAEVEMQAHFDHVLGSGYGLVGGEPVYAHLYFDGLAVLLQGLERTRAKDAGLVTLDADDPRARTTRLLAACDLLSAWPDRFMSHCRTIQRPYSVFVKDHLPVPYWLHGLMRRELAVISAPLLSDEVEVIRGYVGRQRQVVSSRTVSALSGRDVSRHSTFHRVDGAVGEVLLASLDHRIAETKGVDRFILLRDKFMITAGRCLALGLEDLSRLDVVDSFEEDGGVNFWDGVVTPREGHRMLSWYVRRLRPQCPHKLQTNAMFTTAKGQRMSSQAIGARFALAVQQGMLNASVPGWRSWANPSRRQRSVRDADTALRNPR